MIPFMEAHVVVKAGDRIRFLMCFQARDGTDASIWVPT
jgi:hypothetical protein